MHTRVWGFRLVNKKRLKESDCYRCGGTAADVRRTFAAGRMRGSGGGGPLGETLLQRVVHRRLSAGEGVFSRVWGKGRVNPAYFGMCKVHTAVCSRKEGGGEE